MNFIALLTLITVTTAILIYGLKTRSGVLQFPFLAAAVCGGWFIPQAIGLEGDLSLPNGAYATTMFYAAACMVAIWFGDRPTTVRQIYTPQYNERRLLIAAAGMSFIGGAAYSQILNTPTTLNEQGLTTGIVTVLFFFSKLQYFGLALALIVLFRRYSIFSLMIVLIDLNMILGFILFGGRRGPAVEVTMIILTSLWFQRRIVPPRGFILALALFAMIFGNSVGQYRSTVQQINSNISSGESARLPTISEIIEIDFLEEFKVILNEGSYEVKNAIYMIGASSDTMRFTYGIPYWNYFVFSYVPAQFVGRDTKDALMFAQPDIRRETYGYISHIGTTNTGFADSFAAFWLFGVFVFFAFSRLLRKWWSLAMSGSIIMQFMYATTITTAMHSITHGSQWFIAFLPYAFGICWAVAKWAGSPKQAVHGHVRPRHPTANPVTW